jgi:hypothetical protein
MDKFLEFLSQFNWQTILSMGALLWYFTRDIKNSIDTLDKDIRAMNTRISRIEGTVYGREIYNQINENNKGV